MGMSDKAFYSTLAGIIAIIIYHFVLLSIVDITSRMTIILAVIFPDVWLTAVAIFIYFNQEHKREERYNKKHEQTKETSISV